MYLSCDVGCLYPRHMVLSQNGFKKNVPYYYNMPKYRKYSIVFHNVKDDSKQKVLNHFQQAKKLVCALEPYNHQEGHHIHVYMEFENQRNFTAILSQCKALVPAIVSNEPPGHSGEWGRVQVDQMRGNFEQAIKYLEAPDKEKKVDPNVSKIDKSVKHHLDEFDRWMIIHKHMLQEFYFPDLGQFMMLKTYHQNYRPEDPIYTAYISLKNNLFSKYH